MPEGYHHLTYKQRCQIDALLKSGESRREIAVKICIHRSAIYRELERNSGKDGYDCDQAHAKACVRSSLANAQPRKMTPDTVQFIEGRLCNYQWSPEKIAGRLKREKHPLEISHETIYRHIWKDKRQRRSLMAWTKRRKKKSPSLT